jgi:hypothetical protein
VDVLENDQTVGEKEVEAKYDTEWTILRSDIKEERIRTMLLEDEGHLDLALGAKLSPIKSYAG